MTISLPKPSDLGFPPKFKGWRPQQPSAIRSIIGNKKDRFIIQSQPTGSGKSLTYVAAAILGDMGRTVILTSTKALQDQLLYDFGSLPGVVDIRGQVSYKCRLSPSFTCSDGPCHFGMECGFKQEGCPYYDQIRKAKEAKIVITNYSFWMTMAKFKRDEPVLGEFDLLVMDEAHEAPMALMDFVTIYLDVADFKRAIKEDVPDLGQDWKEWVKWASKVLATTKETASTLKTRARMGGDTTTIRKLAELRGITNTLEEIQRAVGNGWYISYDRGDRPQVVFGFTRPSVGWAERLLFQEVEKVVLMSATVRPKTAELLGLVPEVYCFEDYPSTFPRERCPVYHVRTLRMNKDTTDDQMKRVWIPQIDRIIGNRKDRKGIIHTHSYDRMKMIRDFSRHAGIIYTHGRTTTRKIVEEFKLAHPPAVMVSPVLVAGWDFAYDMCEYMVIGKLPFPSFGDPLLRERAKYDPTLIDYMTMQSLVQMCGRGMRAEDDQCETFIVDDSVEWFIKRHGDLAPMWFLESYKDVGVVPPPPRSLKSVREEERELASILSGVVE